MSTESGQRDFKSQVSDALDDDIQRRVTGRDASGVAISTLPADEPLKPAIKSLEGKMTIAFGIAAVGLSLVGIHTTPERISGWYEGIMGVAKTLGPLAVYLPILFNFITSRGKLKSNKVNADAMRETLPAAAFLSQQGFDVGGLLGALGGGKGVKDPNTYVGLARIIGGLAGGKTGKTIDRITGGMGEGSGSGAPADYTAFQKEVEQGFDLIANRLETLEKEVGDLQLDLMTKAAGLTAQIQTTDRTTRDFLARLNTLEPTVRELQGHSGR